MHVLLYVKPLHPIIAREKSILVSQVFRVQQAIVPVSHLLKNDDSTKTKDEKLRAILCMKLYALTELSYITLSKIHYKQC